MQSQRAETEFVSRSTVANNFLVLGGARCGTTLLVEHLNCHRQIHCHGEILSEDQPQYGRPFAMQRNELKQHVASFFRTPPEILRGAKILTYQLDQLPIKMADLMQLLERPLVVAIYREDTLDQYVSLMLAKQTGVWHSCEPVGNEAIRLDPAAYALWLDREYRMWQDALADLETDQVHYVSYEQFTRDVRGSMHAIFDFLGLERCPTSSSLIKMNPSPLAEKLDNYQDFLRADVLSRRLLKLP